MLNRLSKRLGLEESEMRQAPTLALVLGSITSSYTLIKTASGLLVPRAAQGRGAAVRVHRGRRGDPDGVPLLRAAHPQAVRADLACRHPGLAALSLIAFAPTFQHRSGVIPVVSYLWVNLYGLAPW